VPRVLVTGGTGFIAGWCIVQLVEAGHEVVTTVRSPERERDIRAALKAHTTSSRLEFATADLTSDAGWDAAMEGCEYVLHVASPLSVDGEDGDSIISLARDGTLRVLEAADRAGVERVVVTSSCAAATPHSTQLTGTVDESWWTDADEPGLAPYRRSKALAERAAWDYADSGRCFALTTVLPAAVFGPALSASTLGSLQLIAALLDGSAIAIPRLGFEVVDVRDVAAAHLLAMTKPEAANERFIVSGDVLWFGDIAEILREHLGSDASRVPTQALTDDEFRTVAQVSPQLRTLLPLLGRELQHSPAKAKEVLGWRPRSAVDTIVDSARCLIAFDAVS
jgi:nucleoside-diphosphate-sugar epimerase